MTSRDTGRRVVEAIPDTWLDPLLTGPNAVIGQPPYDCQDIEHLLKAIRDRAAHAKATKGKR